MTTQTATTTTGAAPKATAAKKSAPKKRTTVSIGLSPETLDSISAAAKRFGAFGVTERKLKKLVAAEAAARCADLDAAKILHDKLTADEG